MDCNIIKKSLSAILEANEKATEMINIGIEPPEYADKLQDCLLGILTENMSDMLVDEFIYSLYTDKLSLELLCERYFA